jgi:hypothetical protein
MGAAGLPIMTESNNVLYPYPVVDRSILLGSNLGGGQSSTSTSSALIYLNGSSTGNSGYSWINSGNVGIGTTTPTALLDVAGTASASGNISLRTQGTAHVMNILDGGSLNFKVSPGGDTGAASALYIDASGNIGMGGRVTPRASLDVSGTASISGGLTIGNGTTATNYIRSAYGPLVFNFKSGTNSWATGMTLQDMTGNVGIGNTTPVGLLDVSGATKGKALTMLNETGDQAIFTASASGTTRYTIANDGSINQSALTSTGIGYQMTENNLTTGTGLAVTSTSTGLTTGQLMNIDWSPGSATVATGDLVRINVGPNGTIGNLFNVTDSGSTLFSVSETGITANLPTSFTSAGDVSMAYDLIFNNATSSYIKSNAPLYIEAGPNYASNNLTLRTFNAGDLVFEASNTARMIVKGNGGNVGIGNMSPVGLFDISGAVTGKALVMINETGDQALFTASAAGVSKFTIDHSGNVGIGTIAPSGELELAFTGGAGLGKFLIDDSGVGNPFVSIRSNGATERIRFDTNGNSWISPISGNFGIGNSSPVGLLDVSGAVKGKALTILNETGDQSLFTASKSGVTKFTIDASGNVLGAGYFAGQSGTTTTIQASGTTVGPTGSGSVVFQDASGVTKARLDTTTSGLNLGDSSDGAYATTSAAVGFNNDSTPYFALEPVNSTAVSGQKVVPVANTWHLSAGDEVLLIQMTGAGAGDYEFRHVSSVSTNTSITLDDNLTHNMTIDATSAAQIVEIPQFTDVTISGSGYVIPRAWNGQTGGIIAFRASGIVNCATSATDCFTVQGRGFRGGASATSATAYQGEGIGGVPTQSTSRWYTAGGGAAAAITGSGGGGGGGIQANGTSGSLAAGGGTIGSGGRSIYAIDFDRWYMGAGGGGGGDDTDIAGTQGGSGDAGGGIIFMEANKISFASSTAGIDAQGNTGNTGSSDGGGGGGGGGGMIWLRAGTVSFLHTTSSPFMNVSGGGGGALSGSGAAGGAGGTGQAIVQARSIDGSNNDAGDTYTLGQIGNSYGTFHIGKIDAESADVAERYQSEEGLEPGDIVQPARTTTDTKLNSQFTVSKTNGSGMIMGAVSTKPGLELGSLDLDITYKSFPIALSGRTPVKVSSENGVIHKGDPIALSSISGYGARATTSGYIVGYALDTFDPETTSGRPCPTNTIQDLSVVCGSIMTFIHPTWYAPELTVSSAAVNDALDTGSVQLAYNLPQGMSMVSAAKVGIFTRSVIGSLAVGDITASDSAYARFGILSARDASISGVLRVDTLFANHIVGMDIMSDTLRTLSLQVGSLASLSAGTGESTTAAMIASNSIFETVAATLQSTLSRAMEFIGSVTFRDIATFIGNVVFKQNVSVEGDAKFTGDLSLPTNVAGTVIVPKYTQAVDVTFSRPFAVAPVITLTLSMNVATDSAFMVDAAGAAVTNVTTTGFRIVLPSTTIREYSFNYIALVVKDKTTTAGVPVETSILGQSTPSGALLNLIATPSATPVPWEPILSPTPVWEPVLSPTPVIFTSSGSVSVASESGQTP